MQRALFADTCSGLPGLSKSESLSSAAGTSLTTQGALPSSYSPSLLIVHSVIRFQNFINKAMDYPFRYLRRWKLKVL